MAEGKEPPVFLPNFHPSESLKRLRLYFQAFGSKRKDARKEAKEVFWGPIYLTHLVAFLYVAGGVVAAEIIREELM